MIAAWELLTPCIVAGSALGHPMPAVFQAIGGPEIAKGNQAICPLRTDLAGDRANAD